MPKREEAYGGCISAGNSSTFLVLQELRHPSHVIPKSQSVNMQ
jgi:hypothetical protein